MTKLLAACSPPRLPRLGLKGTPQLSSADLTSGLTSVVPQLQLHPLGQSGCRLQYRDTVIYIDPYLSNSVQELDSPDLKRLVPIPIQPREVVDANWVMITHTHIDHCDPHTLPLLANASPSCRFLGPAPVRDILRSWGFDDERCVLAQENWISLTPQVRSIAIPAAHLRVERDADGNSVFVGYLVECDGLRVYFAGDTCITQELLDRLHMLRPIHVAVLPVNEHNFFRGRRGIVGNMSVREAFQLAEEIGIPTVIPVHWDMFEINSASPDEIYAVYRQMNPSFSLRLREEVVNLCIPL